MSKPHVKPGQSVPVSGQYKQVTPSGKTSSTEVTLVHNKPAPPTTKPGSTFVLTDPTKHKK